MNKKGVLLLSTLFFIVVLIMMSVALFGLTQNNFKTNKDYFARQEAMNNAEDAIQILTFLISHSPESFMLNTPSQSITGSGSGTSSINTITFPSLNNPSTKIGKIFSNFGNVTLAYNIAIINLADTTQSGWIIRQSNGTVQGGTGIPNDISINNLAGKNGAVVVFWKPNFPITERGSVIFFGNSTNSNNVYYGNEANTIFVDFNGNQLSLSATNGRLPLYSSYNRSFADQEINVNGSRKVGQNTLMIMALGYSKVPASQRYVITYINQSFANAGFSQGGSLVSEGSTIIDSNLEVGTYDSNRVNNRFYSNTFDIKLNADHKTTKFYTVKQDSNGNFQAEYGGLRGEVIAKTNSGNSFEYDKTIYTMIDGTDPNAIKYDQNKYNQIKDFVGAEFVNKTIESGFDSSRKALINEINSKFTPGSYAQLNAGYYVFVNENTVVYFPPDVSYTQIDNYLKQVVKSDGTIDTSKAKITPGGVQIYNTSIVGNEIYAEKWNLVVKKDTKIGDQIDGQRNDQGKFIHITSWKAQYKSDGSVDDGGDKVYRFGKIDVGVRIDNGSVLWYDKGAIVIDGIVKTDEEGGGALVATKDPSNDSLNVTNYIAPVYYDNNVTNYWQSYNYENGTLKTKGNTVVGGQVKQGDIIARFSQVYQGYQNVAILADNNLYINPLSEGFAGGGGTSGGTNGSNSSSTGVTYSNITQQHIKDMLFILQNFPNITVTGDWDNGHLEITVSTSTRRGYINFIELDIKDEDNDGKAEIVIDKFRFQGQINGRNVDYRINDNDYGYAEISGLDISTAFNEFDQANDFKSFVISFVNNYIITGNTENSDRSTTQQDQQKGQQQMEKEKNKRGKANEQILGTDVKLNGLIMVGGNLKAITGNNNRLWFSGMVVTKGNVGIKGTSKVDFFYDPSLFNISFLQSASIRYRGYEYRIYDTLRR